MAFTATTFIFDGIDSSTYGLYIGNTSRGSSTSDGIGVSFFNDISGNGTRQLLLGVKYDQPLTFTLDVFSETPIDGVKLSAIQNWLVGRNGYKKLQITQEDLKNIEFNCVIGKPKITSVGNIAYMLSLPVTCDSPWAYEVEKEIVKNTQTWTFNNTSGHWDFLVPNLVEITCRGGDVKITNVTENNRQTLITGRVSGEIITMSEETGIVKSSNGLKMIDQFNKKFLHFIPGQNDFVMEGVTSLKIKYNLIRKVVG